MSEDFRFEITERIGVIKDYPTGWRKEINMVSWNGGPAKVDIRDWDETHEHMSRGITLTEKEMAKLMNLVQERKPELMKMTGDRNQDMAR